MAYVIAFYEKGLSYGGPEESGWWYDTGKLVRVHMVEKSQEKAYARACRANQLLRVVQKNVRSVS